MRNIVEEMLAPEVSVHCLAGAPSFNDSPMANDPLLVIGQGSYLTTRAYATLLAGCDFAMHRQFQINMACPWSLRVHERLLSNHLRELDQFLCVFLEEAAELLGGPDHDVHHFARLKKTTRKLYIVEKMIGNISGHNIRLTEICRIAMRLHQRGQPVSSGYAGRSLLRCTAPEGMSQSLQSVAQFYHNLGNDLMRNILNRITNS